MNMTIWENETVRSTFGLKIKLVGTKYLFGFIWIKQINTSLNETYSRMNY